MKILCSLNHVGMQVMIFLLYHNICNFLFILLNLFCCNEINQYSNIFPLMSFLFNLYIPPFLGIYPQHKSEKLFIFYRKCRQWKEMINIIVSINKTNRNDDQEFKWTMSSQIIITDKNKLTCINNYCKFFCPHVLHWLTESATKLLRVNIF